MGTDRAGGDPTPRAGDGGAYRKTPTQLATDPAFTGTYVQVAEHPPTPQRHGATGNGVTDDTAALQAFFAANYTQGYVPPGTYLTSARQTVPALTMDLRLDDNAVLKATSSMTALLDTPVNTQVRRGAIRGGVLACNNLATTGLYLRYVADFNLSDITVLDPAGDAFVFGDPTSADTGYGVFSRGLKVDRPSRSAKAAGSRGLYLQNVTDCKTVQSQFVGCDIGVHATGGGHQFVLCNVWGYTASNPTTAFYDQCTGTDFYGCVADTPTTYGYRLTGANTRIVGGKVYNNTGIGTDNVLIGVQATEIGASAFFTVIGVHFHGADGTHRIAKDVNASDANNPMIFGNQYTNVVTSLSPQNRFSNGLFVNGASTFNNLPSIFARTQLFAAAGTARSYDWSTGGSVGAASVRWKAMANSTAEAGSNAGSDWELDAYTDGGVFLATALSVPRSNQVVQAPKGLATKTKAGAVTDADFTTTPPDGTIAVDQTNSRFYVRVNGTWKSAALA